MRVNHILESRQFDRPFLERFFRLVEDIETNTFRHANALSGKIMATLFYEPSTRTRLSFESAMLRLGGRVISTENAREFSSVAKGETLEDTVRVISGYADVIVLRHPEEGACKRAANVSNVPIVNAGDGPGEHPTQALVDVYTIYRELGRIDGIHVVTVGDLANGRTVRSLCLLLGEFSNVFITFVAPKEVGMREDIKKYLDQVGIRWRDEEDLLSVLPEADVVYQTRIQKERIKDPELYNKVNGIYILGPEQLKYMRKDAIIMHPLPRVGEIDPSIDNDPRAAYFRQARNGLWVRMAVLEYVLCGVI